MQSALSESAQMIFQAPLSGVPHDPLGPQAGRRRWPGVQPWPVAVSLGQYHGTVGLISPKVVPILRSAYIWGVVLQEALLRGSYRPSDLAQPHPG